MNLQMMDLAKLKVVELRAELTQRGLDAKGNKPVLVERLRKALEEESGDPKPAAEASAQDTNEENAGKEAREQTPEPLPPKTPGRSSRSSAASTPSKAAPPRGNPKILLTPLTEKQITPTKSPPAEKAEKTPEKQEKSPAKLEKSSPEKEETTSPEKPEESSPEQPEKASPELPEKTSPLENEAPPDEATEEDKPEDATRTQEETTPEHLEAAPEATKTDTDAAEADDLDEGEETVANVIPDETEPKSEEPVEETEKPALDDEKIVEEDDKEEESSAAAPDASEDSSAVTKDTAEEKIDEDAEKEAVEATDAADDQVEAPETDEEDKLLEDDAMETNENIEDEKESGEPMEVKPEAAEEPENAAEEVENTEESVPEETREEKPKVEIKREEDDKSNVENAIAQNEEQDVEMKEIKEEDDSEQDSKDRDRKDRKDRKRKRSTSPQEDRHKSPQPSYKDDEPDLKESEVVLSWYDSDLNLVINRESFLSATAMHSDGFGYIWAGARASYGFTEGKVYYETKITECCDVDLQDEAAPHVLRVGWSVQGTTMQLGEEPLTYGFGGTGKISTGNRFSDYGAPFGKDDVVGCYLDLTADGNVVMSYTINGKDQGPAFTVSKSVLEGKALFPHVLTKNCTFECNFGQEKSWCDEILEGYVPAGTVDIKERIPGPRRPEKREDCEIVMMCGLPAAGKTFWATKYAEDHPEKMYNVLGTNALIEKMKVIGLPRKRNYHGRWEVLINKCTRCLNKLLDLAATRRRNYILDQTNVYPSAQRRKMRSFYGYKRRAVVIVPTEEEFKSRTVKRTACEGEVAPETAVLEMKANFGAPVVGESFDVVEWVELPEEEAKKLIEKYNKEGKDAGYGQQQQTSKRPRFERSDNHRESRDSRQSSRDSRDSRDHRDRRNNYQDRSRNSTWRGGSSSGSGGGGNGWRDRQQRPAGGHVRHGGGGSGGYGGPSGGGGGGGGWRGRGAAGGPPSSYRPLNDRRVAVHDRRTSGSDRNRPAPARQGGWGPMNSYQGSQQSSGWGGSQSGNWPSGQAQQQGSWGGQQQAWGQPHQQQQQQQQQQQWGNWKGYGQSTYAQQSSYSQQGYGNGNWGSWNQQYYNQYWGQQQPTGQTSAAGSQAVSVTGSTTTGNSTASTGSTYSSYSPAWQGYAQSQSYSFPAESSNTNAQQQK